MRTRKLTFSKERLNGLANEKFYAVLKVFSRKFQIFRKKNPRNFQKKSRGVRLFCKQVIRRQQGLDDPGMGVLFEAGGTY